MCLYNLYQHHPTHIYPYIPVYTGCDREQTFLKMPLGNDGESCTEVTINHGMRKDTSCSEHRLAPQKLSIGARNGGYLNTPETKSFSVELSNLLWTSYITRRF